LCGRYAAAVKAAALLVCFVCAVVVVRDKGNVGVAVFDAGMFVGRGGARRGLAFGGEGGRLGAISRLAQED